VAGTALSRCFDTGEHVDECLVKRPCPPRTLARWCCSRHRLKDGRDQDQRENRFSNPLFARHRRQGDLDAPRRASALKLTELIATLENEVVEFKEATAQLFDQRHRQVISRPCETRANLRDAEAGWL